MVNRKIDEKMTKQAIMDAGIHRELKKWCAESGMSIRAVLERYIAEGLDKDGAYSFVKTV